MTTSGSKWRESLLGFALAIVLPVIYGLVSHGVGVEQALNGGFTAVFLLFAPVLTVSENPWLLLFGLGFLIGLGAAFTYLNGWILRLVFMVLVVLWMYVGAWSATQYIAI